MSEFFQHVVHWLGYGGVVGLCAVGVVLSCLSFSGTWLVVGAAALAALLRDAPFPGWITIVVYVAIAGALEGIEFAASAWGVKRRGGSNAAGFAAMIGGLVGMIAGTAIIPVPVVGGLIGMLVGAFALTYAAESMRSTSAGRAAHVATGAVLARVLVMALKVAATLGMSLFLLVGLVMKRG